MNENQIKNANYPEQEKILGYNLTRVLANRRNLGFLLKVITGELNKEPDKAIKDHFYKMLAETEIKYAAATKEINRFRAIQKERKNELKI